MTPTSVRQASLDMDVAALRALTDGGFFDIENLNPDVKGISPMDNPLGQRFHGWCDRLRHVCAFSQTSTLSDRQATLPEIVAKAVTYPVPVLQAMDDFRAWFQEATVQLVKAWPLAMAHTPITVGKAQGFVGLAHWMACAAMLDLPQVVRQVHAVCPKAIDIKVPIGRVLDEHDVDLHVSPVWFAWHFSSHRCLDAMAEISDLVRGDAILGHRYGSLSHGKEQKEQPVSLLGELTSKRRHLEPDVETLTRAIRLCGDSQSSRLALQKAADVTLREEGAFAVHPHLVEAFLDAGVYALDPGLSVKTACVAGFPTIAERMVPLLDHPPYPTFLLDALRTNGPDHWRALAVERVVLAVQRHHGKEVAHPWFWKIDARGQQRGGLMTEVLSRNLKDLLVALMNAGIVDPERDEPGLATTPMALAKSMDSPLVGVMAAWSGRRSAHALLDQINEAPRTTP